MRLLLIILSVLLILGMVSPLRMNSKKEMPRLYKRTINPPAKGGVMGSDPRLRKGGHTTTMRALRKGEYVCGSRICKLRAGVVPRGCEGGECQYAIE